MVMITYGSIGEDDDAVVHHNSDVEADQDQHQHRDQRVREPSLTEYTSLLPNNLDEDESNDSCCSVSSYFSRYQWCLGVILALLSGALFTGNNFIINQWQVSVSDVVLIRCVITITIFSVISLLRGESLLPGSAKLKFLIILQGALGAITFITALSCMTYIEVPDALCIIFACPIVTIAASAVILRDKINLAKTSAGIFLLVGVVLACKPPFLFDIAEGYNLYLGPQKEAMHLHYIGVLLAVTCCIASGLMDVLVAKCSNVSTAVLVNWSAIAGFVIVVIYCKIEDSSYILSPRIYNTTWSQWATFIGLAISGLIAFATLTKSLHLISPNLVSSLRCLELVLAFSIQGVISGVFPNFISVTGGFLIMVGVIILAFQDEFMLYIDIFAKIIKEKLKSNEQHRADEYDSLIDACP